MTMIPKNTDNPFFGAGAFGANQAAKDMGGKEINYTGTAQPDVPGQIQRIQSAAQQGSCGIAVSGLDPDALAPALTAGQPVRQQGDQLRRRRQSQGCHASCGFARNATQRSASRSSSCSPSRWATRAPTGSFRRRARPPGQNAWIEAAAEEAKKPEYADMKLVKTLYGNDVPQTVL